MGWNSGSDVYQTVYESTLNLDHEDRVLILTRLIGELRNQDWDVYDEVFLASDRAVVEAFRQNNLASLDEDAKDLIRTIQDSVDQLVRTYNVDIEAQNSSSLDFRYFGSLVSSVDW